MQQSFRGEPIKSVIDQIRHMGLRYPEESGDFALGYASFFEQRIEAHRQLNLQLFSSGSANPRSANTLVLPCSITSRFFRITFLVILLRRFQAFMN